MSNFDRSSKKISLLYMSSDKFPPFRVDVGVLFGDKLVKKGHRIDWVLQSDKPLESSSLVEWKGSRVWVGKSRRGNSTLSKVSRFLQDFRNDLRVFSLSRNNSYDFIQVKDKFVTALFALIAARLSGTKFIYWLSFPLAEAYLYRYRQGVARYPALNYLRGHFFKFILYKIIMPCADHVFVQSNQMRKDIAKEGIDEKKMTPVPMGVDITSVPYKVLLSKRPGKSPMVVYLGTLSRVRKMDFLVRAFKYTLEDVPDAVLYFVGSGDYDSDMTFLEQEAKNAGISGSIVFTGFLPMKDAWHYVAQADVCVSPFYPTPILNSTSPTKLVEYMAMGKAVVANDHPEQSLVISESGAGICVPYDEKSFGDAMSELLKEPEKARLMGMRGRQYVMENRTYDVLSDRLEQDYLSMLG